jgi:hypothetical protein
MSGQIVNNPLHIYGVEVAIYTRIARKKETRRLHLLDATASWQMETSLAHLTKVAASWQRRKVQKTPAKEPAGKLFSSSLATLTVLFVEAVRGQQHTQPQQKQTLPNNAGGAEQPMKNQHTEQQVVTCPLWTICLNLQQLCSKS